MKKLLALVTLAIILLVSTGCKKEPLSPNPGSSEISELTAKGFKAPGYNPKFKLALYSFSRKEMRKTFVWTYRIENYRSMMARYGSLLEYTTNRCDYFEREKARVKSTYGINLSIETFDYTTGEVIIKGVATTTNNFRKICRTGKISLKPFSFNIKGSKKIGVAEPVVPALPTN